mmetsp:Transcript_15379/g.23115  ORF Transcript_15379/g.23115 Transcript_15379/m.23115 type:complete len:1122 (-) Transcript_15379:100-3465(-)
MRRPDTDPPPQEQSNGPRRPGGPPIGRPPALRQQAPPPPSGLPISTRSNITNKPAPPSGPPPSTAIRALVAPEPSLAMSSVSALSAEPKRIETDVPKKEEKKGGRIAMALPPVGAPSAKQLPPRNALVSRSVAESEDSVSVKQYRKERAPAPYRLPPGAPPGKPPPRHPPPSHTPQIIKGAPQGRRPPPLEESENRIVVSHKRPAPPSPLDEDSDYEDSDLRPPPPDEDEDEEEEQHQKKEPPPPVDPPPKDAVPLPPSSANSDQGKAAVGGGEPTPIMPKKEPRPPDQALPETSEEMFLTKLIPGRLSVKCIEGLNIHRYGKTADKTKIDAYVRVTLGKHRKATRKKTRVHKRSGANPQFDDEIVSFDVVDPSEIVVKHDVHLIVELWDENAWSDDLIAYADVSILALVQGDAPSPSLETLALRVHNPDETKEENKNDATRPTWEAGDCGIRLEFRFEPAAVGMCIFTLIAGRDLKNVDTVGKQDPYVKFTLEEGNVRQSKTRQDGGTDPNFNGEEVSLWVEEGAWIHDLVVQVFDEDIGTDDLIGESRLSLLPYMTIAPKNAKEEVLGLTQKNDTNCGELLLKIKFLPAGVLRVRCVSAKNLRNTMSMTGNESTIRQDPYLVLTIEGQCCSRTKRTHVDQDGGGDPEWNETLSLSLVDQYELKLECYDHDVVSSNDELIGSTVLSLLPAFKRGLVDSWFTLKKESIETGYIRDAGDVHLILDFDGPDGVKFPQYRVGIDAFDEKDRVNKIREQLKKLDREEAENANKDAVQLADRVLDKAKNDTVGKNQKKRSEEFTDKQIEDAFKFIDLDKNNYIGAAEIRHVLICMGELITDEEVDAMIQMVDADGDGQVSYSEFYDVVTDPTPEITDFIQQRADAMGIPLSQDGTALNAKAHNREKELKLRNKKREMLARFVDDNDLKAPDVRLSFDRFRALPDNEKKESSIDYETFCRVLDVEETGETHILFSLFDQDKRNFIDIKQFILGMANYVDFSHEERLTLVFDLYDQDRSGFLSIGELTNILMANHMQGEESVKKKVDTIMKQADRDGDGTLSRPEFAVVGQKFPTLLFPKFLKQSNQDGSAAVKIASRLPHAPKTPLPQIENSQQPQNSNQGALVIPL